MTVQYGQRHVAKKIFELKEARDVKYYDHSELVFLTWNSFFLFLDIWSNKYLLAEGLAKQPPN